MFDENIMVFRMPDGEVLDPFFAGNSYSYLVSSFEIYDLWDFGTFKIFPTEQIILPGAHMAFISRVSNPDWVGRNNCNLFGVALATLVSVVSGYPCQATRSDHRYGETLSAEDVLSLAIQHPVKTSGPGGMRRISRKQSIKIHADLDSLVRALFSIDYNYYFAAMQSLRLLHLSVTNLRDDFGLAYLLVVSAIEAIAQKAITKKVVAKRDPTEDAWELKAKSGKDQEFSELYKAYKDARSKDNYLKQRYVEFIARYAQFDLWERFVSHPMQNTADDMLERGDQRSADLFLRKAWNEYYPGDLSEVQLRKILSDSYSHRSKFVHSGTQPPHLQPRSYNRFFQEYMCIHNEKLVKDLLPNCELLQCIAKHAITNWINSRIEHK